MLDGKDEINWNRIKRTKSYCTINTHSLGYEYKSVNVVQQNSPPVVWDKYKKYNYTQWKECRVSGC